MSILKFSSTTIDSPVIASVGQSAKVPHFNVAIVGGGPAGTGMVVAALQSGKLDALLDSGVAIFEAGQHLVRGNLGNFCLNSDTLADTFLEVFDNDPDGHLTSIKNAPATNAVAGYRGRSVPLPIAGDFLQTMGECLRKTIDASLNSKVWLGTKIESVVRLRQGGFFLEGSQNRVPFKATCTKLVLATGGSQDIENVIDQTIENSYGHSTQLGLYREKILLTHRILSDQSGGSWRQFVEGKPNPKVTVIGSSHSAFSTAWTMLQARHGVKFGRGGITILHRSKPRLCFDSPEAAIDAGYTDFDQRDVCPLTGRLFRLAGLRFDGRELLMKLLQVDGFRNEERVCLQPLNDATEDLEKRFRQSDLIVPAFGYRPRAIEMHEQDGRTIEFNSKAGGAFVDDLCRVLRAKSHPKAVPQPIENLFAMGLASGYIPSGELGGEPSFRGQTNGFWLYQNGVGEIVLDQVMAGVAR